MGCNVCRRKTDNNQRSVVNSVKSVYDVNQRVKYEVTEASRDVTAARHEASPYTQQK